MGLVTDEFGEAVSDERKQECCKNVNPFRANRIRTDLGQVICCDGEAVICLNERAMRAKATGRKGLNKKAYDIVKKCTLAHEQSHVDHAQSDLQLTCEKGTCAEAPFKVIKDPRYRDYYKDRGECDAFRREYKCYKESMKDCGGDSECRGLVRDMILYIADHGRPAGCDLRKEEGAERQ